MGTLRDGLSRFAGLDLALDHETYTSASETNHRNRAIAQLLHSLGALRHEPTETLDLYTRQSCLAVTARDLAIMGATLADGGVNPHTGVRVVSAESCRYALTVMTTPGLYETSGDWLYQVGLPGKSGIGGGIVGMHREGRVQVIAEPATRTCETNTTRANRGSHGTLANNGRPHFNSAVAGAVCRCMYFVSEG